ncbi:MAG: hypothetical protein HQ518_12240 [Rhodopirellula sp.]|nr:hypothetical protein [Rhodopirellula sp.]
MKTFICHCLFNTGMFLLVNSSVVAQPMVYTTTPLQTNGDRFFESTNMHWSLHGPNFFATFGSPNIGIPPFGGYNPNAGISSGWAFNSGKSSGNFGFNLSQGYQRFSTTTAPSLMTTNGQTGQFFRGVQRPFIYSLAPVVPTGGAFFSTSSPAFHQQYELPSSVAERVLRGDLVLPPPRSATRSAAVHSPAHTENAPSDPAATRINAAHVWFQNTPQRNTAPQRSMAPPTPRSSVDAAQPEIGDTLKPQEPEAGANNAAAFRSSSVAPTPPHADIASQQIAEVYFQRGLAAEAKADTAKASFLFRIAADRASGKLKDQIDQHLRSLASE